MYTPNSSIVGYRPIAPAWRDALAAHGATPDADAIIGSYNGWCGRYHLDPNIALAQACHESAWFTSARWRDENNPAGLGIVADNTPPNPFRTPDEGIEAHCEHLCCYVYTLAECPVDHAHMADRRHAFHDGLPRIADLERLPARAWANPGTGYVASIVAIANQVAGGSEPVGNALRIVVHAGHEHIGSITADKIGQASADALRTGTGANGEMQWTPLVADALVALLKAAGVDAVRTDAIYHDAVYAPDADLVIALHYDGVGGTGRAQYCMAATVHSGPSTVDADAVADTVIADWYALYPARMGIAGNGPITTGMTQYYGGWYRTANTPMILIEHCIGADGGGIRADRPTPEAAAAADFAVLAKHFNLTNQPPAPQPHVVDGQTLGDGFWAAYSGVPTDNDLRARLFGLCLEGDHDEYLRTPNGAVIPVVAARFERQVLIWDRGATAAPWDVRAPLLTEHLLRKSPPPPLPRPKTTTNGR